MQIDADLKKEFELHVASETNNDGVLARESRELTRKKAGRKNLKNSRSLA